MSISRASSALHTKNCCWGKEWFAIFTLSFNIHFRWLFARSSFCSNSHREKETFSFSSDAIITESWFSKLASHTFLLIGFTRYSGVSEKKKTFMWKECLPPDSGHAMCVDLVSLNARVKLKARINVCMYRFLSMMKGTSHSVFSLSRHWTSLFSAGEISLAYLRSGNKITHLHSASSLHACNSFAFFSLYLPSSTILISFPLLPASSFNSHGKVIFSANTWDNFRHQLQLWLHLWDSWGCKSRLFYSLFFACPFLWHQTSFPPNTFNRLNSLIPILTPGLSLFYSMYHPVRKREALFPFQRVVMEDWKTGVPLNCVTDSGQIALVTDPTTLRSLNAFPSHDKRICKDYWTSDFRSTRLENFKSATHQWNQWIVCSGRP